MIEGETFMEFIRINEQNRSDVRLFFMEQWGSSEMVISTGVYDCAKLDGILVKEEQRIVGLITFEIQGKVCEIVSLDSLIEGKGIGSHLVMEVERIAKGAGCSEVKLITTNDNLHALGFYQKRGYMLARLYPNAVELARQRKPSIPLIGKDGIPIRDEIKLVKSL